MSPTIKLEIQFEINITLTLVDVVMTNKIRMLNTSLYRSTTNSGQYLNYQTANV